MTLLPHPLRVFPRLPLLHLSTLWHQSQNVSGLPAMSPLWSATVLALLPNKSIAPQLSGPHHLACLLQRRIACPPRCWYYVWSHLSWTIPQAMPTGHFSSNPWQIVVLDNHEDCPWSKYELVAQVLNTLNALDCLSRRPILAIHQARWLQECLLQPNPTRLWIPIAYPHWAIKMQKKVNTGFWERPPYPWITKILVWYGLQDHSWNGSQAISPWSVSFFRIPSSPEHLFQMSLLWLKWHQAMIQITTV